MKKFLFLLGILLVSVNTVFATSISFREGDGGSYSSMDGSYIRSSPSGNNYGTSDFLLSDAGGMHGMIKFSDIFGSNAGQIALGSTITSASLTIYHYTGGHASHTLNMIKTDWDEDTVTWNNFGTGNATSGTDWYSSPTDTFSPSNGANVLDVTSSLQAFSDGSVQNYGWILVDSSTNATWFRSDDYATFAERPILMVEYSAIPEPATLCLLVMGLVGTMLRRRRQG